MSDKPEALVVRMLRWIDSGISRLMDRVGYTEKQATATHASLKQMAATLERIEARLEQIERRLPPRSD